MITAQEAKKQADARNNDVHLSELKQITEAIQVESAKGNYNLSNSGSLTLKTIDKLEELGYQVKVSDHRNESYYSITWLNAVKDITPKFHQNQEAIQAKKPFVDKLISTYDNVCWGGAGSKHWTSGSFDDVVVVYEAGVRGPSEWFFLNNEGKWGHGAYTAYKETYTDEEFETLIKTTTEHNKTYNT